MHIYIHLKDRVAYHINYRVCSTTTTSMIQQASGQQMVGYKNGSLHMPPYDGLTKGDPHRFEKVDADVRFTLVRNPVHRFLSAYWGIVTAGFAGEKICDSIEEFIENFDMYNKKYPKVYQHFLTQTQLLGDDPNYYTHLFKFDEIEKVKELLEEQSQRQIHMPISQQSKTPYKYKVTKQVRRFIEDKYKIDYENGYDART